MSPVERREVEVDGRRVRYHAVGEGDPLVLVHGLAGSWRWWKPVLEPLTEHRELHVVDLPHLHRGWGVDRVSHWLAAVLDGAGLERVDLAAHSLGGLFAAELAATEPERVRKLVLVAPAGVPDGKGLPSQTLSLLTALYHARHSLRMITTDVVRSGPLSVAHGIEFLARRDLSDELGDIQAPTLLVWGERDELVPFRLAEDWQRLLPRARLVRLGCGHVPMLEAPGELADAMLAFLDERP
jgi:pimeloyl-ACP methyl ester carboxylesterase